MTIDAAGSATAGTGPSLALRRGTVLCLVSAAGFGIGPVIAEEAYAAGVSVPTLLALRFAIAAVVLWGVVVRRRHAFPPKRVLVTCAALGGVGYACQAELYFASLARIDAALAALLLYTYPALVTVLAVVLRRASPDRRRLAALACSGAGVLLLLGPGSSGEAQAVGVLLALGAALSYALYLTVAEGLPVTLDLHLLSAVVCTAAALSLSAFGLATGTLHSPDQVRGWGWPVLLALLSTVVPMLCLFAGMRAVGASAAAILSCVEPVVTVVTTSVFQGEHLTAGQAVGGAAVVSAVAVLRIRRRPRDRTDHHGL